MVTIVVVVVLVIVVAHVGRRSTVKLFELFDNAIWARILYHACWEEHHIVYYSRVCNAIS